MRISETRPTPVVVDPEENLGNGTLGVPARPRAITLVIHGVLIPACAGIPSSLRNIEVPGLALRQLTHARHPACEIYLATTITRSSLHQEIKNA